jgi:hypothetical protein
MKTSIVATLPPLVATIVLVPVVLIFSLLVLGPATTLEILRDSFGLRAKRATRPPAASN